MRDFSLLQTLVTIAVLIGVLQGLCSYLVLLERKVAAWVQNRLGPNRVGPSGLFQPVADGLKFIFKEQVVPRHVDKFLYFLAPCIATTTATLGFSVVPFGATGGPGDSGFPFVLAPGIDIGVVFIFAAASLTVYAIILGGWAGNNKYSFLGGLRSSAQLISYEIPLGMSILGVVIFTGSLNLENIIWKQANGSWNIFYQPLAFLLFMVSAFAECNRLPFDLPEAEQELVGGYHTEYSAWKLALFFLGEYTHLVTTSFLMVILFFGGWHLPWLAEPSSGWIVKLAVFAFKMSFFMLLIMLIRWTIPRFRFDQLMNLAWTVLIPLALANLVAVMVVMQMEWSRWWLLPVSVALLIGAGAMGTRPAVKPRQV